MKNMIIEDQELTESMKDLASKDPIQRFEELKERIAELSKQCLHYTMNPERSRSFEIKLYNLIEYYQFYSYKVNKIPSSSQIAYMIDIQPYPDKEDRYNRIELTFEVFNGGEES